MAQLVRRACVSVRGRSSSAARGRRVRSWRRCSAERGRGAAGLWWIEEGVVVVVRGRELGEEVH